MSLLNYWKVKMNGLQKSSQNKNINYQFLMEKEINSLKGRKPSLLLHSCCAPCSSSVLERLSDFFKVSVLYYNPNIFPYTEYEKRINEQKRLLGFFENINFFEIDYNHDDFLSSVNGNENETEGGMRCKLCFTLRLSKTAQFAVTNKFEYITTSLSVSPHKNVNEINSILKNFSAQYNIKPLYADFKKKDGYKRSIELSGLYNIYRQGYCGCEFSKT